MSTSDTIKRESDAHRGRKPTLAELGDDLLQVTPARLIITLCAPFILMTSYALFAWLQWWPLAVMSVMALSFVTYGSTSHDLVHYTLKLPRNVNDFLLSMIELLSLRSGTAYRLSHLHHHGHLLAQDDVEGAAAHGSFWRAVLSGPTMQLRLWFWAWRHHPRMRWRLFLEAIGILLLIVLAVAVSAWSLAPLVYVVLVIAGSWLYPLATVYLPHDGLAETPLGQTRLFRGWFIQLVTFGHLYHLEHHLYPAVPHHHWRTLADRLDPYFEQEGVRPYDLRLK